MRIRQFNPDGISMLEDESGNEIRVKILKAGGPYEYAIYEIESPNRMWGVQFVGTNKADDISIWSENDLIILGPQIK